MKHDDEPGLFVELTLSKPILISQSNGSGSFVETPVLQLQGSLSGPEEAVPAVFEKPRLAC